LQKAIRQYLQPIEISTNKWSTNIVICHQCKYQIYKKTIIIKKTHLIDNAIIATKAPLNCRVKNVHILQIHKKEYNLELFPSIHEFLHNTSKQNISILPLGLCKAENIEKVLHKFKEIEYISCEERDNKEKKYPPCYIHWISNKPENIYGKFLYKPRKRKLLTNFFNSFKKL
jgi:translation initiation factor 2 gamma subunit (eIF-2gamma)